MFTFAKTPQNIANIFLDSFSLYKDSFRSIWRWQLLWLIPMMFLPASTGLNATGTLNVLSSHLNANATNGLLIVYSLLALIITIYGETFLLSRIHTIGSQGNTSTKESLILAKNKLLPILGGYVVTWFIMLLLLIITGLLFGLILFIFSLLSDHSATSLLFTVPILVSIMIIISILLAILMFLFNLFILFDNYKIIPSIKGSINLVWGNWWRTFAVILAPVLTVFIVMQILKFLVNLVTPNWQIATNIVNLCVLTVLYPWLNSLILIQFNDLKLRR